MIGINIKMPTNCQECDLTYWDYSNCLVPRLCVFDRDCVSEYTKDRPDWCPLIEIKERSEEE